MFTLAVLNCHIQRWPIITLLNLVSVSLNSYMKVTVFAVVCSSFFSI